MTSALIGPGGFVGGNLSRQRPFAETFGSATIGAIRGRHFDAIVCAGVRAEKWKANADPAADRAAIAALTEPLLRATADRLILISTVDVYPSPIDVDESTPIDPDKASAYGRHRYELEELLRSHFPAVTVVRLPGLFGEGLKKNVIFDLLHDNMVEKIHPGGVFQYYNLAHLADDLDRAVALGAPVVNFATEPVGTAELARAAFGRELAPNPAPAGRYDFRSRHADRLGGTGGYLYPKEQVLAEIVQFVADHPTRTPR